MSQENVELVRTILDDVNADRSEVDAEGLLTRLADEELLDPEIEWDASEIPILDLAGVYRGIEGVRQYWRGWLAAWELGHFEFHTAGRWGPSSGAVPRSGCGDAPQASKCPFPSTQPS